MRIWILSDLHIEQSDWDIPDPAPDFDVLIAAGDIHDPLSEGVHWLAERAAGRPVIYVPGNHEWYAYRQPFTMSDESKRGQVLAEDLASTCFRTPKSSSMVSVSSAARFGPTMRLTAIRRLQCDTLSAR